MSRQHPIPHVMGNTILIFITVSEIRDHCQNLLYDPRMLKKVQMMDGFIRVEIELQETCKKVLFKLFYFLKVMVLNLVC